MNCIECNKPAQEQHHVIPKSLGGNATVPLCNACHARVHGLGGSRRDNHKLLTRLGLIRRNEAYKSRIAAVAYLYLSGQLPAKKKDWPDMVNEFASLEKGIDAMSYVSVTKYHKFICELVKNDSIEMLLDCFDMNDNLDVTLMMSIATAYNNYMGYDALDKDKYPDYTCRAWPELTGG
jgi:hypothetical protein